MSNSSSLSSSEAGEEVVLLSIKMEECCNKRRILANLNEQKQNQKRVQKMNKILNLAGRHIDLLDTIAEKKKISSQKKHTIRTIIDNVDKQSAVGISIPYACHDALSNLVTDAIDITNNIQEVKTSLINKLYLDIDPICADLNKSVAVWKYGLAARQVNHMQAVDFRDKFDRLFDIMHSSKESVYFPSDEHIDEPERL